MTCCSLCMLSPPCTAPDAFANDSHVIARSRWYAQRAADEAAGQRWNGIAVLVVGQATACLNAHVGCLRSRVRNEEQCGRLAVAVAVGVGGVGGGGGGGGVVAATCVRGSSRPGPRTIENPEVRGFKPLSVLHSCRRRILVRKTINPDYSSKG